MAAHFDDPNAEVYQIVDSILLGQRQTSVLIEPSAIFVCDSFSEQDVQSNDAHFVQVTNERQRDSAS
jgi:hypothetical protein